MQNEQGTGPHETVSTRRNPAGWADDNPPRADILLPDIGFRDESRAGRHRPEMDIGVLLEGKAVESRRGRAAVTGMIDRFRSISRTTSHCIVDS
ncbi:MAG: hypothetical protein ACYSUU_05285, partial [Planctomycetota bacterium]